MPRRTNSSWPGTFILTYNKCTNVDLPGMLANYSFYFMSIGKLMACNRQTFYCIAGHYIVEGCLFYYCNDRYMGI